MMLAGATAKAQTTGDIVSIYSDQANTTYTASGTDVDIKIRLWGDFRRHSIGGIEALLPQMRLVINGDIAWATLFTLNRIDFGGVYKTEAIFRYTVRPGDMAQPMKIFGTAGSGLPGDAYQFYWNGWEIRNEATTSNAVWRFNPGLMGSGDVLDENFTKAKVVLRTLNFDNVHSPATVAATESVSWRVTTVNPVESGNVVDFYVWSPSNNVRLGTSPGDPLLVSMPQGTTEADFPVFGESPGVAEIYVQRAKDYQNNGSVGVTNFIKRTITVTAAPDPTVSVRMKASGTDSVTLSETGTFNAGSLYVDLSQSYADPMTVRLNISNMQAGETNLSFSVAPLYLEIPAGATSSSEIFFNVPDGTVWSAGSGIVVTPVITNAAAAAVYSRTRTGRVYVQNAAPQIIEPLSTDNITVTRGVPHAFTWTVDDVSADRASGMTMTWSFGDGTSTNVSGATGSVLKNYVTAGSRVVKVKATDKDGGVSAEIQFNVNVVPPEPSPSVRVVPEAFEYYETTTNGTGKLKIYLSETFTEDVWVQLNTLPAGQSNLVLSVTGAVRIPKGTTENTTLIKFSVPDGIPLTEMSGIEIVPSVTNAAAASYYTDMQSAVVYVNNQPPRITSPVANQELGPIPSTVPYVFNYVVRDVNADLETMRVHWRFTDGGPLTTVTGAVGSVSHTYLVQGTHRVWVQAEDKDGGLSDEIEFTIVVGQPPTVTIITPGYELSETANPGTPDQIIVRLSTAFTNAVTVNLAVTPANTVLNGTMTLSAYSVIIPAGQTEQAVSIANIKDGTTLSRNVGFTVTPTVGATPDAASFYTILTPGYVTIRNEAPYFINTTGNTEAVVDVSKSFVWSVSDVSADQSTLQITWNWGDGSDNTYNGAAGNETHTYTSAGVYNVYIVARDKDGGYVDRIITVTVRTAKALNATPVGPNSSGYYGAGTIGRQSFAEGANTGGGIGYGTIIGRFPTPSGANNYSDVYYFRYNASALSATIEAAPYKTGVSGYYNVTRYDVNGVADPMAIGPVTHDSFFLCWDGGTEEGLPESDLTPATANATTVVSLPAAAAGAAGETTTDAEIRRVRAIFSLEWIATDNVGDINKDGIPDDTAMWILTRIAGGDDAGDGEGGGTPAWLQPLDTLNDDLDKEGGTVVGDYYPVNPRGIGGTFNFRPTGNPFIAFNEIRGNREGLNRKKGSESISDFVYPEDEPGTDPTLADTDGDGMPDGWEYWFWRTASFGFDDAVSGDELTGERYNPNDVAQGIFIASSAIIDAFLPSVHSGDTERDFDNDGLKDLEELLLGTNPTHWDTDGDGICDGWEVLRLLDPLDPRDGNSNTDGDYMAYTLVSRQLVTVVIDGETTNMVLGVGAEILETSGTFTALYNYGSEDAPLAVGLPYTLPANGEIVDIVETNALLLHFQVMHELGFDPRTAWTGSVNPYPGYDRFPEWAADTPDTKPFTALDEYLLLKFMSEMRLNDATEDIEPTAQVWESYSTHPLTPDSDITKQGGDGMPDGWELYVAIAPGVDMASAANRLFRISPWNYLDGVLDHPVIANRDTLVNRREFAGTDSSAAYTNVAFYNMTNRLGNFIGEVSISFYLPDTPWINKFWPTSPWSTDTDGDGLKDLDERTFLYGNPSDNLTTCTQGGGLNPNSVDTDWDGLPDKWEAEFAGSMPEGSGPFSGVVIEDGMDGTVKDHDRDWDSDGLKNYQEYWVQSVRAFRYDIPDEGTTGAITGNTGLPMDDTFAADTLWTEVTNGWDVAKYPWGDNHRNLWFMRPIGHSKLYASTDPSDHDTDKDGMDDYYELFHGVNPILGHGILNSGLDDRVGRAYIRNGAWTISYSANDWWSNPLVAIPMDFVQYPWLAGMPGADPDTDGLLNLEEKLQADMAAPANYNTDPSPIWMTDYSSPESLTSKFYFFGGMYFWPGDNGTVGRLLMERMSMFNFEMNEGYDTDNDGISDKVELMQSSNVSSSPQDHDDPVRRQALWFDGVQSAAQTIVNDYHGSWALRSFTVELWAYPEMVETAEGQILIERPIMYSPGDLSDPDGRVRRNFRIGIEPDGRVYAMFENTGGKDEQTGYVRVHGRTLIENEWVHLSATMDGEAGVFTLYVTQPRDNTDDPLTHDKHTAEIDLVPANGVITVEVREEDGTTSTSTTYREGPIVVGAACNNPVVLTEAAWSDYSAFFHGYIDEVRIWDGPRSEVDLYTDRAKRYNRNDLLANRLNVRQAEYNGGSRVIGSQIPLPAELLYHFTFDNLFGADRAESVAKAPRGFNHSDMTMNRPDGYEVGWLSGLATRSAVYDDYGYITWIENGVTHLPLFGSKGLASSGQYPYIDKVLNSVYWSHTLAGTNSKPNYAIYNFPNQSNPYGFTFLHSPDEMTFLSSEEMAALQSGDMLPLGNAFALRPVKLWDSEAPGSVWADTGTDIDADGLPDWWEDYVETLYPGADLGWYDLYPDGSGMTVGEHYLRDLALGWTETNNPGSPDYDPGALVPQTGDIDQDGLPDWWETLYNLKIESALSAEEAMYSRYGSLGDMDRDGLSNYAEYLISEHYHFRTLSPVKLKSATDQVVSDYFLKEGLLYYGQMFTDHDFMEDSWEDQFHPYYVSRFVYDAHLDNDQDGWSNWAEARYSSLRMPVRPDRLRSPEIAEITHDEFPVPVVETRLTYNGIHDEAGIVVHAFSAPDMNGSPDAVFQVNASGGDMTDNIQPLGYWQSQIFSGLLSPGNVKPGTVNFRFTDMWTQETVDTGFDLNGKLYRGSVDSAYQEIGEIDYLTGAFTVDMSAYARRYLVDSGSDSTSLDDLTRDEYIDCELSYVQIAYDVALIDGWPKTVYLGRADTGHLREGANYFFAFLDLDASGQWSAGEPCGVAEGFAVDVGWDRQRVNIELTDYRLGYLRMSLADGLRSDDIYLSGVTAGGGSSSQQGEHPRIIVNRLKVDGLTSFSNVLDKTMVDARDYLHEGDFMANGKLALDWGLLGVANPHQKTSAVYEVRRGDPPGELITVFTNTFAYSRAKAVATYPANAYVYSARPEFRWTMPEEGYQAFAIEIKKNSTGGTTVYSEAPLQAPPRNVDGEYVWRAPIYANTRLPNGEIFTTDTVYYWRVMALNAKFTNTILGPNWSEWKAFRLDVNRPVDSSGYGEIRARVKYYGPANSLLTGRVKVQVYDNAAFAGLPEAEYTLAGIDLTALTSGNAPIVNAILKGLVPSSQHREYYLRAYIDHNQNNMRDVWESWGYANYYGLTDKPHDPRPVWVSYAPVSEVVDIIIEDADTDQDWFPDAWEFEANPGSADFLTKKGPATGNAPDTEINPTLSATGLNVAAFFLTMSSGTTDGDADGLGDLLELTLGSDATALSSSGDGYLDGDKVLLGFDPSAFLTLNMTGLDLNSAPAPVVNFDFGVEQPDTASSALLTHLSSQAAEATRDYEILYKQSLSDAAWTVVHRDTVPVSGVQSLSVQLEEAVLQDLSPENGFFRIRLVQ